MSLHRLVFNLSLLLLLSAYLSNAAYFKSLGVNFGQLGDDLPSAAVSVRRITRLRASAVKIYDANPAILAALASAPRLTASIMVPNELIPSIAANRSAADAWVRSNLLPFYPRARVRFLLVGNEVLSDASIQPSWPSLVPAVANIHKSLKSHNIHNVKVGTTLAMDALSSAGAFPPSAASFRPDIADSVIKPLLKFLTKTKSHYFLDAYTYFPWSANHTGIDLTYALLGANSTTHRVDPATGLQYTNLLDELLDAVVFAMRRAGFDSVPLLLAETGWPNAGDLDQIGANVHNAATYNRNLARRLRALPPAGTPARPGAHVPTFVFALYNEDRKPGPGTERHFGLLHPNGAPVYEVDLTGRRTAFPPLPPPTNDEPYGGKIWCVLAAGAGNESSVGDAVSYACGQGMHTCDAIQKGRECYQPDDLRSHASYAFNSYWQQFRRVGGTCYFGGLAVQTTTDPSHGSCKYPSLTTN